MTTDYYRGVKYTISTDSSESAVYFGGKTYVERAPRGIRGSFPKIRDYTKQKIDALTTGSV